MELARWEPSRAVPSLRRKLDRWCEEFEDFFEGGRRLPRGRVRGPFERSIPLPVAVQSNQAQAQCQDGVLEITIPKAEEAKARRIPIQAS